MKRKNLIQRLCIFLFTVMLLLCAIAVTMNRDVMNFTAFRRWLLYGDLELSLYGESDSFSHAGGDSPSFALSNQGVLLVSTVGSRFYSFRGDILAERVVSYTNPILHKGNNATVVYDAGGSSLTLYQQEKEVFALNLGQDDAIISARLNENDWLVTVTQEKGYKGIATIYNNKQEIIMDISLSTTFVTDAFLSPDNRSVVLVTVGQTAGVFETTLLFYDIKEPESKKSIQFSGKVIFDLDYEKNWIWLLSENEVTILDTNTYEKNSWNFPNQYLKDANLEGEGFATLLLGQYRAGTANRLVTIDSSGKLLGEMSVTSSPLALSSAGQYVAYLTQDRLTLLDKNLQELAFLNEVGHANQVALTSDGTVLLASQQEAWLYLPNLTNH